MSEDQPEKPLFEPVTNQFNPRLIYLGVAMIVLLLANTFLASQKNRLQAEIDRQTEVIAQLRAEVSLLRGSAESATSPPEQGGEDKDEEENE